MCGRRANAATVGLIVDPRHDPFHGPSLKSQVALRGGATTPLETYDVLTAARDGRPPEIDGDQGMRAKAIALTIYESATTGQEVRVADVLSGRAREYQRPIDDRWGL
jgi:hypothetical protein